MNNNNDNIGNNFSDAPDKTTNNPIIITNQGYDNNNGTYQQNAKNNKNMHSQKNGVSRRFIVLMVAVCIVFSGLTGIGGAMLINNNANNPVSDNNTSKTSQTSADGISTSVSDIESIIHKAVTTAEVPTESENASIETASVKAAPSVVEITTETAQTNSFFGQYITDGAGSGVIISEDGYIITCAHVIEGVTNITVKLTDGTSYVAAVVGSDSVTDIAVIKVEATDLPYSIIGDSSTLIVGQIAIAIGNPLGELGGTVTNGIISALDRNVEIDGSQYKLLQTNAAINPGNSGGGLFDIYGNLIGIVNAKSSGSSIEGLGFAIPINDAIEIAEQLITNGYIAGRPGLGVVITECNSTEQYNRIRNDSESAALINYINVFGLYFLSYNSETNQVPGDLMFGDRIIAIDGVSVSTISDVKSLLYNEYKIGDTVTITIARITNKNTMRSEMKDVQITLIESIPASK